MSGRCCFFGAYDDTSPPVSRSDYHAGVIIIACTLDRWDSPYKTYARLLFAAAVAAELFADVAAPPFAVAGFVAAVALPFAVVAAELFAVVAAPPFVAVAAPSSAVVAAPPFAVAGLVAAVALPFAVVAAPPFVAVAAQPSADVPFLAAVAWLR
jgi:hypothetical protein